MKNIFRISLRKITSNQTTSFLALIPSVILKKNATIIGLLLFLFVGNSLFGQVKIGDNPSSINSSSLLELESSDKGFLMPRMTTAQRDAISTPTEGLEIYNTSTNLFNYYDGSVWQVIESKSRDNHVLVKSASDFPAAIAGVITLDSNFIYEINGSIIIADKINLNGAIIAGLDGLGDQLIYTGTNELFTGTNGGTIRNVVVVAFGVGSQVFNVVDVGQTKNLIIKDCIFSSCKKLGTIEGYNTIYFSSNAFNQNDDGFTFEGVDHLLINDMNFYENNKGTMIEFVDGSTFGYVEFTGGFIHVTAANSATAIDFGTGVTLTEGGSIKTSLGGDGVRITGTLSKKWDITSHGVDEQTDDVATGNFYISSSTLTSFPSVNTPVKIEGTTTAVNLFRVTSSVDNRLTYDGTKTRNFIISCSLSLTSSENNRTFNFYVAKNGVILPETKQRRKMANGADVGAVSISGIVRLATGDYIEVWIENTNNTSDATVESLNLSIL